MWLRGVVLRHMSTLSLCWSCHGLIGNALFFCPECSCVLPPQTDNFFKVFGIENPLDLKPEQLDQAYFELQKKLHPDHFIQKSVLEKRYGAEQSMLVNQAYETLKNPLSRYGYLLAQHGFSIQGEFTIHDQDILEDMMDWRERAMDEGAGILPEVQAKYNQDEKRLRQEMIDQDWQAAYKTYITMVYTQKLIEDLK